MCRCAGTGSSAVVTIGPDGVQTDQGGPASAPATASTSAASAASSGSTFHRFVNNTKEPLDLSWGDDHYDNHHGTVEPGKSVVVGERCQGLACSTAECSFCVGMRRKC